ncbi:hypothetical protein CspeluHIS016_0207790 [Cutaneotrichosporon spelunceum]|uniref:Citrate transporter-like domain-containing protein n=1 Tax=Cutaneotrichosporon spelunceum TaxID=1672016 RepID=A0AAD3TRQ0_9TREE|nr:hypothetical protein CspeluHIS016_0207790 [Cutaneotrichosporon spelunceum]
MTSSSPGSPGALDTPQSSVSKHAFQATPGTARVIDARSIVTLVVFFAVNVLVIFPLCIPLPRVVGRVARTARDALLGQGRWDVYEANEGEVHSATDGAAEATKSASGLSVPPHPPLLLPSHLSAAHSPGASQASHPAPDNASSRSSRSSQSSRPSVPLPSSGRTRSYFTLGLATAPVAGVLLLLASTCIPGSVVRGGIVSGVRPYDIMTLFLSFAYISLSLDCTGLLRFLAFTVAARASSSGRTLFLALYALFALLSLVVGNDPVILSGTPFVAYFTIHTQVTPTPFLFAQFQAANLASALLVSSNPTNLVLTSSFHLSFLSFSAWTALPTVAAALLLYPVLAVQFRKQIPKTLSPTDVNPRGALIDPVGAIFTSTVFIVTIIVLVALSAAGLLEGVLGVWTVTAPAAILVLIRDGLHDLRTRRSEGATLTAEMEMEEMERIPNHPDVASHVVSRLPLPLLPFAFSMFILVDALDYTGWVSVWARWWAAWARAGGTAGCIWLMGVISVLGCNILGTNIGLTVLLSRILVVWRDTAAPSNRTLFGSVIALAIGSNFGAYSFVFSASLAGLLWRDILAQKGLVVGRLEFIRWNMVPLWTTMVVACLIVAAEVCVMF